MGNNHGMTPGYIARAEEQRLAALDWERYNAKKNERKSHEENAGIDRICPVRPGGDAVRDDVLDPGAAMTPELCTCLEIMGDDAKCPVHGDDAEERDRQSEISFARMGY